MLCCVKLGPELYVIHFMLYMFIQNVMLSYFPGHIPIGFNMVRYKLHPNGIIGDSKNAKPSTWHATWVRNDVRDDDGTPV